jgi:acetylornithine deacetylase
MSPTTAACWESVDLAIDEGAEAAFSFLERLVAERSTVGQERGAQELVAGELARLGFGVRRLEIPAETGSRAPGGVAQAAYHGRSNVLGLINPGMSPSLMLNGHIDVVPADDAVWASDPFTPVRSDGWLSGRGAGDMKAGFAMGLLAVQALRAALPDALSGELAFLSVLEEECTGEPPERKAEQ